jgi:hypothetical protein
VQPTDATTTANWNPVRGSIIVPVDEIFGKQKNDFFLTLTDYIFDF